MENEMLQQWQLAMKLDGSTYDRLQNVEGTCRALPRAPSGLDGDAAILGAMPRGSANSGFLGDHCAPTGFLGLYSGNGQAILRKHLRGMTLVIVMQYLEPLISRSRKSMVKIRWACGTCGTSIHS